jgi:hypothetical protein
MKYYLQNRYQDSGWEKCVVNDQEFYDRLQDALYIAEQCAADSICYGMVRVVDSDGKIHQTWAAGSGVKSVPAPITPGQGARPIVEVCYNILLEDVAGTGAFTKSLSVKPNDPEKIPESLLMASHIASQVSKEYPGRKVIVQDTAGNIVRTIIYTGVDEEPLAEPAPQATGGVGNLSTGPRPVTVEGDEDDDDFEFIDLTPTNSRISGFDLNGQVFITVATIDALFVEMQLNNVKNDEGSFENDFLLKTLRDWLTRAEKQIRGTL